MQMNNNGFLSNMSIQEAIFTQTEVNVSKQKVPTLTKNGERFGDMLKEKVGDIISFRQGQSVITHRNFAYYI